MMDEIIETAVKLYFADKDWKGYLKEVCKDATK